VAIISENCYRLGASVVQLGASLIKKKFQTALQRSQQRAERGVSAAFDIAAQGGLLRRKVICPKRAECRLVRPVDAAVLTSQWGRAGGACISRYKQRKNWRADTIRTCDLCLRRATLSDSLKQ